MKTMCLVAFSLLGLTAGASLAAQEPHTARISIIHPGIDGLTGDLKSMIDLTTPEEQETWVDLKDYFDLLAIGVDGSRQIRVDVLTELNPVCYLIWVPLSAGEGDDLADEFRENLDAFGYLTRRDPQNRNLYEIEQEPEFGWLRVIPELKYGVFVITEGDDDLSLLKQIILKVGDPLPDVEELAGKKASVAAELVNTAISPEDQEQRRTSSRELRKISLDALQQRPDESDSEFGMRQNALETQLDEAERLIAESAKLQAWATYDRDNHTAEMRFTATAIPDTSLHAAIQEFGKRPDVFASIPAAENSAMSVRLNHPIDSVRQENALEFMDLLDSDLKERIGKSEKLSDDEKAAALELAAGILDIARDAAKSGNANAIMEGTPDSNDDFTIVLGMAIPEAARVNDLIPLFGKAGEGNQGESDVDSVGDFKIHRIRIARGAIEILDDIFGEERDMYIAVAETQIWLASGENAIPLLKTMVGQIGEPETHNKALHIDVRLLKWVERLDAIADKLPEPELLDDKEAWRDAKRDRARAIEALQTDDELVVDVTSEDDTVSGVATVGLGSIRFVGKMVAAFTKENLQ